MFSLSLPTMHSYKSFKGWFFCSTSRFFHKDIHIYGSGAVLSVLYALKGVLFTFGFKANGNRVPLAAIPLPFRV